MNHHSDFTIVHVEKIRQCDLSYEEYVHKPTGLRHVHLQAQDDNNVFLAMFKTPAYNNTGVSHVLEHMVLCGSEHYPVHDAFFAMTNRTLNTGMNAFATPDCSGFHFSTRQPADFDNLLQVYLDGLFFPLLDPLTFAREGFRIEFSSGGKPVFNGVVFNETKGVLSDANERVKMFMRAQLFPDSRYSYYEGGEPLAMTELTIEQIRAYHRHHYHAANAIFVTYGNNLAKKHQERFITYALKRVESTDVRETLLPEPFLCEQSNKDNATADDTANSNQYVMSWRFGHAYDLAANLQARLLWQLLIEEKTSRFQQAITELGIQPLPGPISGWNNDCVDIIFSLHLSLNQRWSGESPIDKVIDALSAINTDTFSIQIVQNALDKIELDLLDIESMRETPGLSLIRRMVPALLYGGDATESLKTSRHFPQLRKECESSDFIPDLVNQTLVNNKNRFAGSLNSIDKFHSDRTKMLDRRLTMIWRDMNESGQSECQRVSRLLRNQSNASSGTLPMLDIDQIQLATHTATLEHTIAGTHAFYYANHSNAGISHLCVAFDLNGMPLSLIEYLPLYKIWLGHYAKSFSTLQSTEFELRVLSAGEGIAPVLLLQSKALNKHTRTRFNAMLNLISMTVSSQLDSNLLLIAETQKQVKSNLHKQGHEYAMRLAASSLNTAARLENLWNGLGALKNLQTWNRIAHNSLENLQQKMNNIDRWMSNTNRSFFFAVNKGQCATIKKLVDALPATLNKKNATIEQSVNGENKHAWLLNTDVNYCAQALLCKNSKNPRELASLNLLAALIEVGFLRHAIRHQGGAYGTGARYDQASNTITLFSYRDPRLLETMRDFDNAWQWLTSVDAKHHLEQAKLTALASEERNSMTFTASAMHQFFDSLIKLSRNFRDQFKRALIDVPFEELRDNLNNLINPEQSGYAVLTHFKNKESLRGDGYDFTNDA